MTVATHNVKQQTSSTTQSLTSWKLIVTWHFNGRVITLLWELASIKITLTWDIYIKVLMVPLLLLKLLWIWAGTQLCRLLKQLINLRRKHGTGALLNNKLPKRPKYCQIPWSNVTWRIQLWNLPWSNNSWRGNKWNPISITNSLKTR